MRLRVLVPVLALLVPCTLSAVRQPGGDASHADQYLALLSTYRTDPATAAQAFSRWPLNDVGRAIVQVPRTHAGDILRASGTSAARLLNGLALLHMETAFAHYERNDGERMGDHLVWSRRLVRRDLPWPTIDRLHIAATDPRFVTDWRLTITGFFHNKLAFAEARRFLDEEIDHAPRDPLLLLARGMTEEISASERAQLRPAPSPRLDLASGTRGRMPDIGLGTQRRRALLEAARLYRTALVADSAVHDARLRLGRVLFELGGDGDAVVELERTLAQDDDRAHRYLAHLFLAAISERRGGEADAASRYLSAADLFPAAQAPYLGLSRLQSQRDPSRASETLREMFGRSLPPSPDGVPDPWWMYDAGYGASLPARLEKLRAEASVP